MKFTSRIIDRIALLGIAMLALCLTSSCVNDAPDLPSASDSDTGLTLTLTLNPGQIAEPSRSSADDLWADPYESSTGDARESIINSVIVYAYTPEGQYFGQLTNLICVGDYTYQAHLTKADGTKAKTEDLRGKNLRLHVFINTTAEPADTEDGLFTMQPKNWNLSTGNYASSFIPMWGVTQVVFPDSADTKYPLNIGQIDLIRSVAKVEVILDNSDDEYDYIDNISISTPIARQFCPVPGYAGSDDNYAVREVTATTALKQYYDTFKISAPKTSESVLVFPSLNSDRKRVIFYIPEQPNSLSSEVEMIITAAGIKFDTTPLLFRNYDSDGKPGDKPFNILRNHHYRYHITIRKGRLQVTVMNWEYEFVNRFSF